MRYAQSTSVSSEKSRAEIEQTLVRYGADGFGYGWQDNSAIIGFRMRGRSIKFVLPLPDKNAKEFTHTPSRGNRRHPADALREWEQATRQRWRALLLSIKAKLEAVECGIATFESEFMANVMLPNGQTVGDWLEPQIEQAYQVGKMPVLLMLPAPKEEKR